MGRLTTHVLDTSVGKPAAGVRVVLRRVGEVGILADVKTNSDGRLDAPLLDGDAFSPGLYEIEFHAGDYFRSRALTGTPFLEVVPVRFILGDEPHYHVPLLISPYGYSTYRGS